MFADDEESDKNAEKMTQIRERKDELEESARTMGLYLEDWTPIATGGQEPTEDDDEESDTPPQDILLHTVFTVGDLAFSDRVQVESEEDRIKREFDAIMNADIHDKAIDAREKLRRSGLIDEDEL